MKYSSNSLQNVSWETFVQQHRQEAVIVNYYWILSLAEFVDWLWHTCAHNIHPGANFQRLDTCFRLIQVILGSFELRPHQNQRKGGIPGTSLCSVH